MHVPRTALNILAKRLDRLLEKLNDNNTIVREWVNPADSNSWEVALSIRSGGSVMRILSPEGRRTSKDLGGAIYFPCLAGSVYNCMDVVISANPGGVVSYKISCEPVRRVSAQRYVNVLADAYLVDCDKAVLQEEWLVTLFPSLSLSRKREGTRYRFVNLDSSSFLASLVAAKASYTSITELLQSYLGVREKKEIKVIGEIKK